MGRGKLGAGPCDASKCDEEAEARHHRRTTGAINGGHLSKRDIERAVAAIAAIAAIATGSADNDAPAAGVERVWRKEAVLTAVVPSSLEELALRCR